MDEVEALYQWLAADPSSEADRILAAGLEHAEPAYARRMVTTLLQRRNPTAWVGLVANYDRLDPAARQELAARSEWTRAGIIAAMRRNGRRERLNGLTALADHPCLALCYVVADALRDSDAAIRSLAGLVLRRDAEQACVDREAEELADGAPSRPAVGERAELVAALREAVRTFKFHEQAKIVEAGLWFARDLGDSLWGGLSAGRSPVARVVARHLESWDHPRLAGFLLLALVQPGWREAAQAILSRWRTTGHFVALLRHSDLLADARLQRQLRLLKRPEWIGAAGPDLLGLPPNVRARVPLWLCCLGFSDEERARWLKRWVASSCADLHCAAVRALATLRVPQAACVLAGVAARPGPMQYFAQCYVSGRRGEVGGSAGAVRAGRMRR
jgi:hypothetical protein